MKTKQKHYRQCTFQRPTETGTITTVGWSQEEKTKLGRKATIKEYGDDIWWDIIAVSGNRLPEDFIKKAERSYLKQRGVSDI